MKQNILDTSDELGSWRIRWSMATVPDGYMLPPVPVSEAVCLCTPIAEEHGWKGAIALVSCLWVPGQQLVGYYVNRLPD